MSMAKLAKVCVTRDGSGGLLILRPGDAVPKGVKITNPDVIQPQPQKK